MDYFKNHRNHSSLYLRVPASDLVRTGRLPRRGVYNGWEKWAKARVSWLFFFLRMKVSWKEGEEPAVSLRILGFPVYHSDEERWSLLNRKAADDVVEIRESGKDIRDRAEVPRGSSRTPG